MDSHDLAHQMRPSNGTPKVHLLKSVRCCVTSIFTNACRPSQPGIIALWYPILDLKAVCKHLDLAGTRIASRSFSKLVKNTAFWIFRHAACEVLGGWKHNAVAQKKLWQVKKNIGFTNQYCVYYSANIECFLSPENIRSFLKCIPVRQWHHPYYYAIIINNV